MECRVRRFQNHVNGLAWLGIDRNLKCRVERRGLWDHDRLRIRARILVVPPSDGDGVTIGWLVRQYGAAAGSLRSAEVVTADGRLLQVDDPSTPICSGDSAAMEVTSPLSPHSNSICIR